jgi:two-component system, NarL family, sensor kinase
MEIELVAYQRARKKWTSSFLLFSALFLVGCSESVPESKEVSVNGNVQKLISQMEFGNCDSVLALLENNKLVLENPLQDKLLQINCLYLKGELDEAVAAMDSFLTKPITHSYTQAVAQKLKGAMFYENGDVTSSLRAWIKSYEFFAASKDSIQMIRGLSNISTAFYSLTHMDSALYYQNKALNLSVSMHNQTEIDYCKFQLIPVYLELERYDEAEFYINEFLSDPNFDPTNRFTLLLNKGYLYDRKGDLENAIIYYEQALEQAISDKSKLDVSLALHNLAYTNYHLGNFEEAFIRIDSAILVENDVLDTDYAKSIRKLELKYQDLERDKQLQDLTYKTERDKSFKKWGSIGAAIIIAGLSGLYYTNRKRLQSVRQLAKETKARHMKEKELVAMHSSLETLELERKRTAMDLHDGIGALASSVRMRVSLVENRVESDELKAHLQVADQALDEIAQDVKRIAFNIMPTSLNHLGLIAGIEDFIHRLAKPNNININFYAEVDALNLDEAKEISVYRIAQELINNGLKYSNASDISLELTTEDQHLILYYFDNGKGIDFEKANRGNGISILNTRVDYLKGKLEFKSNSVNGTTFKITLPYEP